MMNYSDWLKVTFEYFLERVALLMNQTRTVR